MESQMQRIAQMEIDLARAKAEALNLAAMTPPIIPQTPPVTHPVFNQPINPMPGNPTDPTLITKRQAAYEVFLVNGNMAKFGIGVTIGFVAVGAISLIAPIIATGFSVFCVAGCAYITKITQDANKKLKEKYYL